MLVPAMGCASVLSSMAFIVLVMTVTMPASGALPEAASPVAQVQSVDAAGHNASYSASSVTGRKDGGGGGGGGGGSSGGASWSYGWGWGWGTEGGGGGGGGGGGSGGGGGGGGGGGSRGGGGGSGGGTRAEQHGHDGRGTMASRGSMRRTRRHRPSYSSSLYLVGEYARCTAPGRCSGMRLLCPMHCDGPCFYDCDANCKAHCRF